MEVDAPLRCGVIVIFKQKTAYEMRISDWSSDVCSSDLGYDQSISTSADADAPKEMVIVDGKQRLTAILGFLNGNVAVFGGHHFSDFDDQIVRAAGRERVGQYV